MQLEYAKNPVWVDAEQTRIDLIIKWEGIAEEFPFTADPTDPAEHGRAIFAAALAGQYGSIADYVPPPPPEPVPVTQITRRQGRLTLHRFGLLTQVEAYMQDPNTDIEVKITYEDATTWYRNDPMINVIGSEFGLTEAEIDELFIQASKL